MTVWKCNSCAWIGTRGNCDNHIRATGHSVSPKEETVTHICGATVNAKSVICYRCREKV